MKTFFIFLTVLLFSLIPVFSVSAITVNINEEILNRENINSNTEWTVIDGSQYSPWELGIRSIYIAMHIGLRSTCVGNGVVFAIRPFNDDSNMRLLLVTSIHTDSTNTDNYLQYVWLPLNSSNKIEYRVDDLGCSNADVNLNVIGYD